MAHSVYMELAGVNLVITCKNSLVLQDHKPEYQSFFKEVNNHSEAIDIEIRPELKDRPKTEMMTRIFESNQSWSMFRDGDEYCVALNPAVLECPIWLAKMNRDCTKVTVYCGEKLVSNRDGKAVVSNPVYYPLDQILLMYNLAQREGALFHAAGISINGNGYIFPGKSGAGKTTITRQFAAREGIGLLSDDRVVVRKIDGSFKAYGTPWPGEAGIAENTSAILSGIFLIHHGSANRIKEITRQEALEKVLPVTSIPWYDPEIVPKMLSFCGDLISNVPTYELHFKPGIEVVDVLEEFVST